MNRIFGRENSFFGIFITHSPTISSMLDKNILILYPPFENSTTRIAIIFSNTIVYLVWQ